MNKFWGTPETPCVFRGLRSANIRSHPAIAKAFQVNSTSGPWHRQSITDCLVLVLSTAVFVIAIESDEYLELLDATGRILRTGKLGSIPSHLAGILDRLGIRSEIWSTVIDGYERIFEVIVAVATLDSWWIPGMLLMSNFFRGF